MYWTGRLICYPRPDPLYQSYLPVLCPSIGQVGGWLAKTLLVAQGASVFQIQEAERWESFGFLKYIRPSIIVV